MRKSEQRSGDLFAVNDEYIYDFLSDENYLVTSDSIIWTLITKQGHVGNVWRKMSPVYNSSGYGKIGYGTRRVRKYLAVHRIVYAKFIGSLSPYLVINHIDGDAKNNQIQNLELITQSENNEHRFKGLGRAPVIGHRKLTDNQVIEVRELKSKGWANRMLRERFGVSKATISYVVNFRTFRNVGTAA